MMVSHESVLGLVESLNGDNTASKRLRISHLDDIWLYAAIMEEPANSY